MSNEFPFSGGNMSNTALVQPESTAAANFKRIRDWVQEKAQADNIPFEMFGHDPEVFNGAKIVEIAGFSIPLIGGLTTAEDWFYRKLQETDLKQLVGTRSGFGSMMKLAKVQLDIDDPNKLFDVITGGTGGILKFADDREADFLAKNADQIDEFIGAFMRLQNNPVTRIIRCWFFLLRCNPELDPAAVVKILPKFQEKILELITLETNGGEMPAPEPADDVDDAPTGNETPEPQLADIGPTLTGSSMETPTSESNGLTEADLVLSPVG